MKVQPLKGFGAFDAVLQKGTRFTVGPIGLTVLVNPQACTDVLNVGVAIGKRTARLAVVRVRMRRLLRVAIRETAKHFGERLTTAGITTIILIWRKPVSRPSGVTLADVQPYVDRVVELALRSLTNKVEP